MAWNTTRISTRRPTTDMVSEQYLRVLTTTSDAKSIVEVTVSTRQNLDLVCDLAKDGWWLCHLTVEMQIPSFRRTIVREERKQDWTVSVMQLASLDHADACDIEGSRGCRCIFRLGSILELDRLGYGMDLSNCGRGGEKLCRCAR